MYFIALVAPDEINQHALQWKLMMKERFGCEVALRSPAHITLIPPFWMKDEMENDLISALDNFSKSESGFDIVLRNFNHFKPKVIFIDVVKNGSLISLQQTLENYLISTEKIPIKKDDRPFHPHVTIATRDLHKKAFYEAWEYFKDKNYEAEWLAQEISILRHNKKNWDVIHTSQFK
jgi:2'-5' RNA ligase